MKETGNEIPDFSGDKRKEVPEIYKWKVEDIYPDFLTWEEDRASLLEMIKKIDGLAREWAGSGEKMYEFLHHFSEIRKKINRLMTYIGLLSDTDMADSNFQARKGELHMISVDLESRLSFMDPDVLKLGKEKIGEYIKAVPALEDYELYFDSVLRMKKHILSTPKEEIIAQTELFSGTPEKAAEILNDVDMPAPTVTLSTAGRIKLNRAAYVRYRGAENRPDRTKVIKTFWRHHAGFQNTHAVLLDGLVKSHVFNTRVRRFKNSLQASLYPQNIHPEVYHTLVRLVRENLAPFHRYLRLKAGLLDLPKMNYADIYASSVPEVDKSYSLEEARSLIMAALEPLGTEYGRILKEGLQSGWTDVYPNRGKRSGAYSNGNAYDVHPYVLLNYNGKFDSVTTLAHEFGHALHSYFSNRSQPFPTAAYPIFLAEIASTFNETLLIHFLLEVEKDDLVKLYIVDQYLEMLRTTLYRQTLFADFEWAMHREVEKGKTLTPDWLNTRYLELTRLYYGHKEGILDVDTYIRNEWSGIPHFYYNFYVYQYSTGIVASTALGEMVLGGGEEEKNRYLDFLKKGGSQYPLEALEEAGVDLKSPGPILSTVHRFEQMVTEMEKLVEKLDKREPGRLS